MAFMECPPVKRLPNRGTEGTAASSGQSYKARGEVTKECQQMPSLGAQSTCQGSGRRRLPRYTNFIMLATAGRPMGCGADRATYSSVAGIAAV